MGYKTITTKIASARSTKSKQSTSYQYPSGNGVVLTGSSINSQTSAYLDVTTPGAARSFTAVSGGGTSTVISNIQYLDANNVVANANAVSTTGGNILINGNGFANGSRIYVNNQLVTNTFVNSNAIIATLSANSVGNVSLAVFNSSGQSGVFSNSNIRFSGAPSWVTAAAVSSVNGVDSNIALQASGDGTLTYSLKSGSGSLPTGITLLSSGYLTGTATGYSADTVVSFTLIVADSESQETQQNFNYTVFIGDTYFKQTSLLLSATVSNTFIRDSSTNNFLITRNGDTRPSRFSPYWPGGWSAYFDGTGDSLLYTGGNSINFGTGDFTMELWVNLTNNNTFVPFLRPDDLGTFVEFGYDFAGSVLKLNSRNLAIAELSATMPTGQWTHVSACRSGTSLRLFINGNQVGSTVTNSSNFASTSGNIRIGGSSFSASHVANGYFSNFRIVKGTALYTANFTPSTTSLTTVANTSLLTLRDAILADDSPYNFTITRIGDTKLTTFSPFNTSPHTITANSYSVYFDGSGDSLTLTGNAAFAFGTGDFTVECWINSNSVTSGIFDTRTTVSSITPLIYSDSTGVRYYVNGAVVITGSVLPLNTWVHIALVRASGTSKLYINGNQSGSSYADSNNYTLTNTVYIGNTFNSSQQTNGWISNFRIVKGTAVYTANFTPSTSALTAISGTSVLACQANTIIDSNTTAKTITVNGNPNVGIANPFGETVTTISNYSWAANSYGASAYFDGTGDYLVVPYSTAIELVSSDFTIETWIFRNADSALHNIWSLRSDTPSSGSEWRINSTNTVQFFYTGGSSVTTTETVPAFSWTHLAVTRSGTTVRIFINGKLSTSATFANGTAVASSVTGRIGLDSGGTGAMNGYLSDFRLTKGTALYTTSFIPPTAPVSNVANVSLLTLQSDIGSNSVQFVDQSTHNHLITRSGNTSQGSYSPLNPTSWSAYLDGTGDYVTLPSAFNAAMGNGWAGGQHTVELWVYPTSWNSANSYLHGLYGTYAAAAANGRWHISIFGQASNAAGKLNFSYTTSTSVQVDRTSATFNIPLNSWTHIAVTIDATTSSNTTVKFFVNGSLSDTFTAQNLSSQTSNYSAPSIGGNMSQYVNGFIGYISNFRHSYNSLVYTNNFTPPSTTLQPDSTTAVLAFSSPRLTTLGPGQFELTRAGDTEIVPFGPHMPSVYTSRGYGIVFDGAGDYLTLPSAAAAQFTMGTGDFTIEMWINIASLASERILYDTNNSGDSSGTGRFGIRVTTAGVLQVFSTTGPTLTGGGSIKPCNWYHIAYSRDSGSGRLFVNGSQVNSTYSDSTNYTCGATNRPIIGINGYDASTAPMYGVISNLRVVKGSALYITNFTPSTSTLTAVTNTSLLTGYTTSIIDGSTNALTITVNGNAGPVNLNPFGFDTTTGVTYTPSTMGGSVYFDGTGDDLQTAAGNFIGGIISAARTFTIECWVYHNAYTGSTTPAIIGDMTPANVTNYWSFGTNSSGQVTLSWYDGATKLATGNTAIPLYNWAHIAVSVSAGAIKLFVNGQIQTITGTSTLTTSTGSLGYLAMGRYATTTVFNGYVSNLRILNGEALYTTSFLLPTTVPSLTATTSLLLPFTNSGIIDSTGRSVLESVADASIVTSAKPYSTGSYYFDGTGDYLIAAAMPMFDIGAEDFTIEAWVYFPTLPSNTSQTIASYGEADNLPRTVFYYDSRTAQGNPGLRFSALNSAGTTIIDVTGGGLTGWQSATWHHVAVTRASNNFKLFRDGVQTGATVTDTDLIPTSITSNMIIGAEPSGAAPLNGYISDIRITRGYARYTANFTVPSGPFVNK